jgi:predicted Ser/Thr protein kinase
MGKNSNELKKQKNAQSIFGVAEKSFMLESVLIEKIYDKQKLLKILN